MFELCKGILTLARCCLEAKCGFYIVEKLVVRVNLALLLLAKKNRVFLIGQGKKYRLVRVTLVIVTRE